jgi:hypothetical protein
MFRVLPFQVQLPPSNVATQEGRSKLKAEGRRMKAEGRRQKDEG